MDETALFLNTGQFAFIFLEGKLIGVVGTGSVSNQMCRVWRETLNIIFYYRMDLIFKNSSWFSRRIHFFISSQLLVFRARPFYNCVLIDKN